MLFILKEILQNFKQKLIIGIEITQDYVYVNESDYELTDGILINKTTLFINGNGHTIDGAGQSRIFIWEITLDKILQFQISK